MSRHPPVVTDSSNATGPGTRQASASRPHFPRRLCLEAYAHQRRRADSPMRDGWRGGPGWGQC